MADLNPFDLLGDEDAEDPSQLLAKAAPPSAAAAKKAPAVQKQQQAKQPAKLPSKPLPPSEAVKEARAEGGRGGGRGGGLGRGRGRARGGGGFERDTNYNGSSYGSREFSGGSAPPEEADSGRVSERRGGYGGPRGPYRGGRRGGFGDGDDADGERPRRVYDRKSGTGRGYELKREGSGRANWGTPEDELAAETGVINEENKQNVEKPSGEEEEVDANKEAPSAEVEEKEPEDKEMTLEEYEKVLEEKRKALQALKTEERKVDTKEFESMQQISKKKNVEDDIFIKLGPEKDKRKESSEKEEKSKKSVSITEFLKPAEGERYYGSGGRGRGRGRGRGYRGDYGTSNVDAPKIEDPGQFPTLGGK